MLKRPRNKQQIERSIHIPYELMQFVQRNTYSLLIKGYAGTGKTTLSLSILRALRIKNNFFYISTRLSPKQLFLYYPWLDKFIEQSKTVRTRRNIRAKDIIYQVLKMHDLTNPNHFLRELQIN